MQLCPIPKMKKKKKNSTCWSKVCFLDCSEQRRTIDVGRSGNWQFLDAVFGKEKRANVLVRTVDLRLAMDIVRVRCTEFGTWMCIGGFRRR